MTVVPGYRTSTDLADIGFPAALDLVRLTDWHATIPEAVFRRACDHSLSFAVLADTPPADWPHTAVAYARVVTDKATYAYLCDVIVHPQCRGLGLSRLLVEATLAHPDLAVLRRYTLLTRHAAGLYRKYDFIDQHPAVTYLEKRWDRWGRASADAEVRPAAK